MEPVLRAYRPECDSAAIEALWRSAMPVRWPWLPAASTIPDGVVAELPDGRVVGFVGVDVGEAGRAGIPLVLVEPGFRRHGLGTALVVRAVLGMSTGGTPQGSVVKISAGSGGMRCLWPGVPRDLPEAAAFFEALGWTGGEDALDLVRDLRDFTGPTDGWAGSLTVGGEPDLAAVIAFQEAVFPNYVRYYRAADSPFLVARDENGEVCGALRYAGPGADLPLAPLLGPDAGTIGEVGVAPWMNNLGIGTAMVARAAELLRDAGVRACHVGWTFRGPFYQRLGFRPWRSYRMLGWTVPRAEAPW